MKNANIKVGRRYMVSLGRRGAVQGTVVGQMSKLLGSEYVLLTARGDEVLASHRRLSPVPVTDRDGNHIASAV